MKTPAIQITQSDFQKLQDLLRNAALSQPEDKNCREALAHELRRAEIKGPEEIPPDVITLNSRARLRDLANDDALELAIVMPYEADVTDGRISILAPLGTAMLGYRQGDIFEWTLPGGPSRFRVEEVLFQPEAAEKAG
jgi:regulator of nucleoside diphosphate kinase